MGRGDTPQFPETIVQLSDRGTEWKPLLLHDEQLRDVSVGYAIDLIKPASRTVTDTGSLFEIADEIAHYIRTGEHQTPKEA